MIKKSTIPWNKGLSKESDERIRLYGAKVSFKEFHKKYGIKNNTVEQIREFVG